MLAADNLEIVDDSMLFTKRNLFLDVFMHRGKQEYSQVHVITSIDGKFGSLIIYTDSFYEKKT